MQLQNWVVTATEDTALFTGEILSGIDVIVMMNPSGDALKAA